MSYLHALIFGIVEGLTEFLPISSTAHLIIAARALGVAETDFVKSFIIIIQLGAILAVAWLYWPKIVYNLNNCKKILTAFIPTALIGLLLYKIVKTYWLDNLTVIVWAMIIGGIILIIFEYFYAKNHLNGNKANLNEINYRQAFLIGVFQALGIIPGTSRSAATIIGGLVLGLSRATIVEFSFLLAIPTMAAATGLDLIKNGHNFSGTQLEILIFGLVVSFITAIIGIKFFIKFIQRHNFIWFGVYRIVLGLAIALFWLK